MNTMNPVIFMPRVMPYIGSGGGGNVDYFLPTLLTLAIVGVIVIMLGILGNILHVKFSQGFDVSIYWDDIKPNIDNTVFGAVCGTLGFSCIGAAAIIGLGVGVGWCIITL